MPRATRAKGLAEAKEIREAIMSENPPRKSGGLIGRTAGMMLVRGFDTALSFGVAVLLASRFGVSPQLDAFFAARRVTMGPTELLKRGIAQIAMPVFAKKVDANQPVRLADLPRSLAFTLAVMIIAPLLLMAFPEAVIGVFAPGFTDERYTTAARVLAVLLPLIPIAIISGIMLTILQARGVFLVSEATRVLQRLALVLFLLLVPAISILDVSYVMLIAALVSLALLGAVFWWYLRKTPQDVPKELTPVGKSAGAEADPDTAPAPKGRIAAAMILLFYFQGAVMLDFAFVSTLPTGSVAALEYGTRIVSLVPGLVMVSVSTVLYPSIVRLTDKADKRAVADGVRMMVRACLFVQFPVSIGVFLVAPEIVVTLFGHAAFDETAQANTVLMVQFYALASVFLTPNHVLTNSIFSDAHASPVKPIAFYAATSLAIRVGLLMVLTPWMGMWGLGLAVVLSAIINLGMAVVYYRATNADFALSKSATDLVTTCLIGAASFAIVFPLTQHAPAADFLTMLWRDVLLPGGVFALAYVALACLVKQPDIMGLVRRFFLSGRKERAA